MTKSVCATCLKTATIFVAPTLFDSRIYAYGSFHRVTGAEGTFSVPYGTEAECYQ